MLAVLSAGTAPVSRRLNAMRPRKLAGVGPEPAEDGAQWDLRERTRRGCRPRRPARRPERPGRRRRSHSSLSSSSNGENPPPPNGRRGFSRLNSGRDRFRRFGLCRFQCLGSVAACSACRRRGLLVLPVLRARAWSSTSPGGFRGTWPLSILFPVGDTGSGVAHPVSRSSAPFVSWVSALHSGGAERHSLGSIGQTKSDHRGAGKCARSPHTDAFPRCSPVVYLRTMR